MTLCSFRSKQAALATTTATAKKHVGLIGKTTGLHIQQTFFYISLTSLHEGHMKFPQGTFKGERKHTTNGFFFLLLNTF